MFLYNLSDHMFKETFVNVHALHGRQD